MKTLIIIGYELLLCFFKKKTVGVEIYFDVEVQSFCTKLSPTPRSSLQNQKIMPLRIGSLDEKPKNTRN